jgi:hypothetical protein
MAFDFTAHKLSLGAEDYPTKHNAFVQEIEDEFNNSLNFTNAAALAQAVIDVDASVAQAVIDTAADVVSTHADVVSTNADVVSTNADVISAAASVVSASGLGMFFSI